MTRVRTPPVSAYDDDPTAMTRPTKRSASQDNHRPRTATIPGRPASQEHDDQHPERRLGQHPEDSTDGDSAGRLVRVG
ncbi:hypothetical protein PG994_002977 [Apiospora phragmitis]|uniref:Uncharacterized protein n=1 Tax=Apiospora phragmitis TaxID=2905665 RepID=A0ABR1W6Q4_9PEZI